MFTKDELRALQAILEYQIELADHEPNYDPEDRALLNNICDKVDDAFAAAVKEDYTP